MRIFHVNIEQKKYLVIKRVIAFLIIIFSSGLNTYALHGTYEVHDPSSIIKCGDTYWNFSTNDFGKEIIKTVKKDNQKGKGTTITYTFPPHSITMLKGKIKN
jgi:hypothetical protein